MNPLKNNIFHVYLKSQSCAMKVIINGNVDALCNEGILVKSTTKVYKRPNIEIVCYS